MSSRRREYKAWEKEKKLVPVMIRKYCRARHGTKEGLCEECAALQGYALFRLEKCPFKRDKKFCSFCGIHCYKPEMRAKIKEVMRVAGPRMLFSHPFFAMSHAAAMIRHKRQARKEGKERESSDREAKDV